MRHRLLVENKASNLGIELMQLKNYFTPVTKPISVLNLGLRNKR